MHVEPACPAGSLRQGARIRDSVRADILTSHSVWRLVFLVVSDETGIAACKAPQDLARYLLSSLYAAMLPESVRSRNGNYSTPPSLPRYHAELPCLQFCIGNA